MNKKSRKRIFEKLNKQAYSDPKSTDMIEAILNSNTLNSIQDSDEYAKKVFELILSNIIESEIGKIESK